MTYSLANKRNILAQNILFSQLSPDEQDNILALSAEFSYVNDQIIFQKGDAGDSLLAVLEGKVSISASSEDGREIILNTIITGEMFGEIAFIDGIERSATATAIGHCTLLAIRRGDFIPFLKKNPEIAIQLLKALCHKLRETSERVEVVGLLPVCVNLARLLLKASEQIGQQTEQGLLLDWKKSQQTIGNEIGVTRESVNKQLNVWRKKNILALGGQRLSITLLNIEALEDIADDCIE